MIKRLIDIAGSLLLLMIFSPYMLIVAAMIVIDSEGGVFFSHRRCGRYGVEFTMYKFRTMVKNADSIKEELVNEVDGPVFKVKNDPRITRVGKFLRKWSIDEFPQLINVLKGDMSLVGPRPLENKEMVGDENWKTVRLSIKPGLTGLWQVMGRDTCKFTDWVNYDIEYVKHQSLFLDIKILLLTIGAVLRRKGSC
ncbi:sugar transferase [Candidatus Magnetominusculus xianensis]|uniref:Multidrug MFS transporter n=1 Tax=Candidatus Magnetominusculus xianensis TaxID=1748249 RepID=A0ABR5SDL9_9BACT|nr:sugar transferase [Candidatus Magnetominusculus xianensis]KWT78181.1 multidrug MFS transporter [Candidatus Magnetominusculus xianensis]MBF0404682.1 sugar transferase [Nitrospirota bacterium]